MAAIKREKSSQIKRIVLFILAVCWLTAGQFEPVIAQTKVLIRDAFFEIDARKAIDSLYNRNTEAAQEILSPWREEYPDHPLWLLWDGMELWWEVLEDLNDPSHDRKFISMMQRADYEAGQVLRKEPGHPDALIIRAVANGYIARLHANREDWLTSVQVGRKAYQAHQELMEVAPDLPDNHFAEGMKLYYAAYIPEAYPVVKALSWFFPEGDRQKGLEELEYAAEKGVFAKPEANYFLATILLNYENHYGKAKERFELLINQYPNNSYYRSQYLRTLAELEEYAQILDFGTKTINHWETHNLPDNPVLDTELNFWIGRAHYYNGDWNSALPYLETAVEKGSQLVNHEEREVYALAAYFAGRTHEILGQNKEARKYYQIAANQKSVPEARKRSRDQLKNL